MAESSQNRERLAAEHAATQAKREALERQANQDSADIQAIKDALLGRSGAPTTEEAGSVIATGVGDTFTPPAPVPPPAGNEAETERQKAALRTQIKDTAGKIKAHYNEGREILEFIHAQGIDVNADGELFAAWRAIDDAEHAREYHIGDDLKEMPEDMGIAELEGIVAYTTDQETESKAALDTLRARKKQIEAGSKTPEAIDAEVRAGFTSLLADIKASLPVAGALLTQARRMKETPELATLLRAAEKAYAYLQRLATDFEQMLEPGRSKFGDDWLDQPEIFRKDYDESLQKMESLKIYTSAPIGEPPAGGKEKESDSVELQKLKIEYEKAKKEYKGWMGIKAVPLLKGIFDKDGGTQKKFREAEEAYNKKLAEYASKYLDGTLQNRINEVNKGVEQSDDERKKNIFAQALDVYKRTGLLRIGIGAALFGLSFVGGADVEQAGELMIGRGVLRGTSITFGGYILLKEGLRIWREKVGMLREIKKEEIDEWVAKKNAKEIVRHLVAHELGAQERNIDIRTDGTYIALLEGLQTLEANALEEGLEKRLAEVDKKRKMGKIISKVESGVLFVGSLALGVLTGWNLVEGGIKLIGYTKEMVGTKEATERLKNILTFAQEKFTEAKDGATSAATIAAEKAHLTTEQTQALIAKAQEAADARAKELWRSSYHYGEVKADGQIDAIPTAAQEAVTQTIDETIKELQQTGTAVEAGKPAVIPTAQELTAAVESATQELSPEQKIDLAKSFEQVARERYANGEYAKQLLGRGITKRLPFEDLPPALRIQLITDVAGDYEKMAADYGDDLTKITQEVTEQKKISLKDFEKLRNIASWHDAHKSTPLGKAAQDLISYIDAHKILPANDIHKIDVGSAEHKTLYDAYSAAEKDLGVADVSQIDKNFLDFMHAHGVAENMPLEEAKRIAHAGEHLWYSKDGGFIVSQEHLLSHEVADTDLGPEEAQQEKTPAGPGPEEGTKKPEKPAQAKAAEKPDQAAPQGGGAPEGRPAQPAQATTSFEVKAEASVERGANFTDAALVKEILELRSFEQVNQQIISDCHARPKGIAKLLIDKGFAEIYPDLTKDQIIQAAADPKNFKANITALLKEFFAKQKGILELAFGDKEATIISPRECPTEMIMS